MPDYSQGKVYMIRGKDASEDEPVYVGSTCKLRLSQRKGSHRDDYNRYINGKRNSRVTAFDIFDKYGGINNCDFILLELCPCTCKEELLAREAHFIRTLKCVNKQVPLRSQIEWRKDNIDLIKQKAKAYYDEHVEEMKQRREEHKEDTSAKFKERYQNDEEFRNRIKEKTKEYALANVEKVKQYKKQWSEEHKEELKEYKKKYYDDNAEMLRQKSRIYAEKHVKTKAEVGRKYYLQNAERINERARTRIECECGQELNLNSMSKHMKTQKHIQAMQKLKSAVVV